MEDRLEIVTSELVETAKLLGASEERNRILKGLNKVDLPVGVWPLIKDIIIPE